jgi:phosphatidylinositol alpha-1,6-mannosyltransferase
MAEPSQTVTQSRLIIITHEFAPFRGGAATYAAELARALQRAGAAVTVWAPDYGVRSGESEEYQVPVLRLRAGGSLGFGDVTQFAGELAARREHLVDATVVLASVGAHIAWMLLDSPGLVYCGRVISLLHGSEVLRFERNPFWRWLARSLFRRIAAVVTVSEFSKLLIEKSFLRSVIGPVKIAPCAASSDAAREAKAAQPEDGKVRIFTLARIHPRKGQVDVARALAKLPAELRAKIIYQIGGTGDEKYLRQIEQTCREGGVAVEYLGAIAPKNLAAAYAASDIFVMTSRGLPSSVEGFGIVYLDAALHGKPVVAYRSGGAAEAVRDGETGILVAEGDENALRDALTRLIQDAELRARLGAAGRVHAAKFSWDKAAEVILKCTGDW